MEKILLAIDAVNLDTKSLDFACYLSRLTKSKVTGVFLENFIETNRFYHEQREQIIESNILLFKEACASREVCHTFHRDRGFPAKALIDESRYADIIVIPPGISFSKKNEGALSEFMVNVLKNAESAVIIAPEINTEIDEIIFTYDGSSSSLFAIKQFTYLFPECSNKKVTILQVNKNGEWEDRNKHKLMEWLKDHYMHLTFEAHKEDGTNSLFDVVFKRNNSFIVMGAYGRNQFSQLFKPSHANFLIKTIAQPIFIAHP